MLERPEKAKILTYGAFGLFVIYYLAMAEIIAIMGVALFPRYDGDLYGMLYTGGLFGVTMPIWLIIVPFFRWLYIAVTALVMICAWSFLTRPGWARFVRFAGAWFLGGVLYIGLMLLYQFNILPNQL